MKGNAKRMVGIQAALASAIFLGLAPIFGKKAILLGLDPMAVVAFRTVLATGFLMLSILAFKRQYFYIYPAGLIGCLIAGGINGVGSIFYYGALGRIDAGLGQLIYSLYPVFVALWLRLDHQPLNRLTVFRLMLTLPALYLLTQSATTQIDIQGMGMMLAASVLYALHLPINQRVLYDMPAPTVTLYTLVAMSIVVVPVALWSGAITFQVEDFVTFSVSAWMAVIALTLVTFLSRLMLFLGVKHLGGLQTALLGLGELIVTIGLAQFMLGETFSLHQWIGVLLLMFNLTLIGVEKSSLNKPSTQGWLRRLHHSGLPANATWQPRDQS